MRKESVATIQCPTCRSQMKPPQRNFLPRDKIFGCACGFTQTLKETEYEAMTGRCFACEKTNCCAEDHRFHGELMGMGF